MNSRRRFIKSVGTVGTVGLIAGCTDDSGGGGDENGTSGGGGEETAQPYNNGVVDFNVSPSVAQEDLQAQYTPVRNHLSEELGVEANMRLANSYSAVIEALGSGTSDVAETGPFAAALGAMSDRAEIVLQRKGYGSWTYGSIISVPQDSDVESLSDLEGATIAFADRLSTSGSLYPLFSLSSDGGLNIGNLPSGSGSDADFEANFAGSHSAAFETLINGQADACATGRFIRETVRPDDYEANLRTVHEDDGLPRAPIVVSPQLSEEEKSSVVDAFVNAPDSIYYGEDGEDGTDDDLWFSDVRERGVDEYQSVIDVANELDVGTEIFEQV